MWPYEHNKAIVRVIRKTLLQKVGQDKLSIEHTDISNDGVSRRSAAGTRFATFKISTEQSKI
jgi:hypothetical protein